MTNLKPLLLWGGVDISPHWYDESPHPRTQSPNLERDRQEFEAVRQAVIDGRPIIGVCRGAQLLCVVNGGKLHQHVPEHMNNSHPIFTHDDKILYGVAADHHQVMIPDGEFVVYATAYINPDSESLCDEYTPEVVYWPGTKCLAVQPHPEWMNQDHPFNVWINNLIKHLFNLDYEVF